MPLTSPAVDALGVATICLVILLVILGLFCIIYTLYFRARIQNSGFGQLGYFNGPWLVRITFIAIGICWGAGEVVRLTFFRQEGKVFHTLDLRWQQNLCKMYILSNLGFTEPCLFLIMAFLLHASLKWRGSGILNQKWNMKTTGYVLLYCLPIFFVDLVVVLVAPKLRHGKINFLHNVPKKFTSTYLHSTISGRRVIVCTYPMLCTIVHGLFATVLTTSLLLLGRRIAVSVINKGLQRRVYILIFLVSCLLPLRIVFLGFSALAWKERFLFEALAFCGFLVLLSCVVLGIFMLVYLPVTDSLALNRGRSRGWPGAEIEGGRSSPLIENSTESLSLIAGNHSSVETSTVTTRNSDASTKRGSISFRTMIKDESSSAGTYEQEMASPGFRLLTASYPGSPAASDIIRPS